MKPQLPAVVVFLFCPQSLANSARLCRTLSATTKKPAFTGLASATSPSAALASPLFFFPCPHLPLALPSFS